MVSSKKIVLVVLAASAAMAFGWSSTARGADEARLEALERRLAEQDKRIAEQDRKIGELKQQLDQGGLAPARREEIEKVIKEIEAEATTMKLGDWLEDFTVFGDVRLRYRARQTASNNRILSRGELRLRVGAKKTWWDKQMEAGFRLESGDNNSPTSANTVMGGNASDKPIWIGRAYAKYKPNAVKGLTVIAGKMANPLVATDMMWDSDVNPEGVFAVYRCLNSATFQPFVGAGHFEMTNGGPLQVYQGGVNMLAGGAKITGAVAWYDWRRFERALGFGGTAAAAGGNSTAGAAPNMTLTAEEFDVFNAIAKVSWMMADLPMSAFVDYARNCADQVDAPDEAYSVGLQVGKISKKRQQQGQWLVRYRYARIDSNAFPSLVSDGDFMGTDRQGHEFGAAYAISEFLKFETELICNEPISSVARGSGRERRLQLLLDLIWSW